MPHSLLWGSLLGYIWADTIEQLILVRFIHGAAAGMIGPVAQAFVGDVIPEGEEGKWMGYFNVALFGGFGVGPLIGGVITDHLGMNFVFYTMTGLSLMAFLSSITFLPNIRSREKTRENHFSFREIGSNVMVKAVFSYRSSQALGVGVLLAFLPIFTIEYADLNTTLTGLLLAVNVLLTAFFQIFAGRLADRFNRRSLVIIGGVGGLAFFSFIPFSYDFWQLLGLSIVGGLGTALAMPAATALLVEEGRKFGMGLTFSIIFVGLSVGIVLGTVLGGIISDNIGISATFYFAALVGLIGLFFFAYFSAQKTR